MVGYKCIARGFLVSEVPEALVLRSVERETEAAITQALLAVVLKVVKLFKEIEVLDALVVSVKHRHIPYILLKSLEDYAFEILRDHNEFICNNKFKLKLSLLIIVF